MRVGKRYSHSWPDEEFESVRTFLDTTGRRISMTSTKVPRRMRELVPFNSTMLPGFDTIQDTVQRMFDQPFGTDVPASAMLQYPPAEITETPEEFTLTAETAGLAKEDVEITFAQGVLTLRGEKEEKKEKTERRYHVIERAYGSFQRSFRFPGSVDAGKIEATFKDGLITIHLPKTPEWKTDGRRIEISEENAE
jgi:HSP20 family protein